MYLSIHLYQNIVLVVISIFLTVSTSTSLIKSQLKIHDINHYNQIADDNKISFYFSLRIRIRFVFFDDDCLK
jgi:hypothetical protein